METYIRFSTRTALLLAKSHSQRFSAIQPMRAPGARLV